MERKKLLTKTLWLLALTSLIITFCYFFIDKQTALWISNHHLRSLKEFEYLSRIPEAFIVVAPFIYLYVLVRFSVERWALLDHHLLMLANVIVITVFLKDFFKLVFGRYWPETWSHNNPSLIKDHEYEFHFFHKGDSYASFPSGHAGTLLAATTLLWLLYPRYRFFYILIVLAGVIGVLGMNYHFVSDILAGGVLGYLIALYTYSLTQNFHHSSKFIVNSM